MLKYIPKISEKSRFEICRHAIPHQGCTLETFDMGAQLPGYIVNHKKGGSTFVIIILENLDGF